MNFAFIQHQPVSIVLNTAAKIPKYYFASCERNGDSQKGGKFNGIRSPCGAQSLSPIYFVSFAAIQMSVGYRL
jgi:hypothetical protein